MLICLPNRRTDDRLFRRQIIIQPQRRPTIGIITRPQKTRRDIKVLQIRRYPFVRLTIQIKNIRRPRQMLHDLPLPIWISLRDIPDKTKPRLRKTRRQFSDIFPIVCRVDLPDASHNRLPLRQICRTRKPARAKKCFLHSIRQIKNFSPNPPPKILHQQPRNRKHHLAVLQQPRLQLPNLLPVPTRPTLKRILAIVHPRKFPQLLRQHRQMRPRKHDHIRLPKFRPNRPANRINQFPG